MLVLSRRATENVSFPQVGITIHFIRVHSGTVEVGIDAPLHVQISCDEIDVSAPQSGGAIRHELVRLPRQIRHSIRNELHMITVGLHLFKQQMHLQLEDDAQETFETVMDSLNTLDANEALEQPGAQRSDVPSARPATVLVVVHPENEREMLASFLRHLVYSVATAADRDETLDFLAQNETPDAMLLDMDMPCHAGATTVRDIRSDQRHMHTRLYAVGDASTEEKGLETGREGVDRWFPKPLNIEFLIDTLASELEVESSSVVAQSSWDRGQESM